MSERAPSGFAAHVAAEKTLREDIASSQTIEAKHITPETANLNNIAQIEIWGNQEGTEWLPNRTATPVKGILEEIRENRRYGTTEAERERKASDYETEVLGLVDSGLELTQAKLIMDLRTKDDETSAHMIAKHIAEGMSPTDATTKVRELYAKKDASRIKLIEQKGFFTMDEYKEGIAGKPYARPEDPDDGPEPDGTDGAPGPDGGPGDVGGGGAESNPEGPWAKLEGRLVQYGEADGTDHVTVALEFSKPHDVLEYGSNDLTNDFTRRIVIRGADDSLIYVKGNDLYKMRLDENGVYKLEQKKTLTTVNELPDTEIDEPYAIEGIAESDDMKLDKVALVAIKWPITATAEQAERSHLPKRSEDLFAVVEDVARLYEAAQTPPTQPAPAGGRPTRPPAPEGPTPRRPRKLGRDEAVLPHLWRERVRPRLGRRRARKLGRLATEGGGEAAEEKPANSSSRRRVSLRNLRFIPGVGGDAPTVVIGEPASGTGEPAGSDEAEGGAEAQEPVGQASASDADRVAEQLRLWMQEEGEDGAEEAGEGGPEDTTIFRAPPATN